MNDPITDASIAALVESIGAYGPEPARLICREVDFGRGMECFIEFAGRHFPTCSHSAFAKRHQREMDEYRLKRKVWGQFWRYLGAA